MSLFSTGVRPVVDDYLLKKSQEIRDYGDYWSASSAGYCIRKNIFERLGVPYVNEDARKQRVFSVGHVFHEWMQAITRDAKVSIAQELELQDEDLMVRGHIDDLVVIEGNLILYDYKTVHSKSFNYKKEDDMSHYHRAQLGTYMYLLRKLRPDLFEGRHQLTEGRILLISKDDVRMMEQPLMWSDRLRDDIVTYWTVLNDYWKEHRLPPCTCSQQEGGFMGTAKYNQFYYDGEPCSLTWYEKCKKEGLLK